jgi:hypothetical protein
MPTVFLLLVMLGFSLVPAGARAEATPDGATREIMQRVFDAIADLLPLFDEGAFRTATRKWPSDSHPRTISIS